MGSPRMQQREVSEHATRLSGVDAARWLLCFPVALLHSMVRPDVGQPATTVVLIAIACRGAVPFFFVASGYFVKFGSGLRQVKALAPVYVTWLIFYCLVNHDLGQLLQPKVWVTGGPAIHLWFIPALMVTLFIIPVIVERGGAVIAGLICTTIAACAVWFDGYRTILGLPIVGGTRLMMAPLLVYIGIILRRSDKSVAPMLAFSVFALAWMAALLEEMLIARVSGNPIVSHAITFSTFLMGPALFLCSRNIAAAPHWISQFGKISLGVYASHLAFVQLFSSFVGGPSILKMIGVGIAATGAATLLSIFFAKFALTRWLVEPRRSIAR